MRSDFTVNSSKTETILFIKKYKIPDVLLSSFGGSRLPPVDKVKNLGIILEKKAGIGWLILLKRSYKEKVDTLTKGLALWNRRQVNNVPHIVY